MTTTPHRLLWMESSDWKRACKPADTVTTVLAVDPIVRLTLPLVVRSGVSPNMVTLIRFFVAIAGGVAFARGSGALGAGAFVGWYLLDCMDGKIARLRGLSSVFGDWFDRMTDRLGVSLLFIGAAMHAMTIEAHAEALLAFVLCVIWLLRVMNGDRLTWIIRSVDAHSGSKTGRPLRRELSGLAPGYVRWAESRRLAPWLVHDVEWLTFALVVGPLTGKNSLFLMAALAGMIAQESMRVGVFWWRRFAALRVADEAEGETHQADSAESADAPSPSCCSTDPIPTS